jgi:hypothetical protein
LCPILSDVGHFIWVHFVYVVFVIIVVVVIFIIIGIMIVIALWFVIVVIFVFVFELLTRLICRCKIRDGHLRWGASKDNPTQKVHWCWFGRARYEPARKCRRRFCNVVDS